VRDGGIPHSLRMMLKRIIDLLFLLIMGGQGGIHRPASLRHVELPFLELGLRHIHRGVPVGFLLRRLASNAPYQTLCIKSRDPAWCPRPQLGGSRSLPVATSGSHLCGVPGRGQSGRGRRPDCLPGTTWLPRLYRWRQYRWRDGPGWYAPGRSAWWCAGQRRRRLPARRAAAPRRRVRR
jgi:hypothetical protein